MKQLHVTISNPEFYKQLQADVDQCIENWTLNSRAKVGDDVLLYICAPVSAVVARATVDTEPVINEDPGSEWFGHYMADMHGLEVLKIPVSRQKLINRFPDWRFFMQPRNSVVVPAYCWKRLDLLLRC